MEKIIFWIQIFSNEKTRTLSQEKISKLPTDQYKEEKLVRVHFPGVHLPL